MKIGKNTKIWHKEKSVFCNCKIGKNCVIHAPVWIGNNVVIGNDCKIQAFVFIPDGVEIGNNVFIGPHVCFTNDKNPPSGKWAKTIIKNNVSIGANATILPGLTIGQNAKIGAGAVVTKNVKDDLVVAGNPAKALLKFSKTKKQNMKKFGIIGLGFIYNRHLEAIEKNNGKIVVGCDIDESKKDKLPAGAKFVRNYKEIKDVDCVAILTPNFLHKEMAEFFAKKGITVLVEKPPVLNVKDLNELAKFKNIYAVLQLRYHPELIKWKENISRDQKHEVKMKILVRRDEWYFKTWKAEERKSGGILFNIGIHYFDALIFMFGKPLHVNTEYIEQKKAMGYIEFKNANVFWEISLEASMDNQKRIFTIDGKKLNLDQGFENLHSKVYEQLIYYKGMPIEDCRETIKLIQKLKG